MSKIRKYKLLRITMGVVLGVFGFLLFVSLYSFTQTPIFTTLFISLFCLFGFFLTLWYIFTDLGFFLNVSQHRKLAKKGTFFLTEDYEELLDEDKEDSISTEDFLITVTPKITKTPRSTSATTKEVLDEIHEFLENIRK